MMLNSLLLPADCEPDNRAGLWVGLDLQPRTEISVAASEVEEFGVGEGLNSFRVGLRLGYEVTRRFAPYIGAYWEKRYGDTADLARVSGDATEDTGVVAGVRLMF